MSLFKKFGQQVPNHVDQLDAFALHLQHHRAAQQQTQIKMATPNTIGRYDQYDRCHLALAQLQILFLAGEINKQELKNATKMATSLDKENLTVVEEIIKVKLG